MFNMVSLYAISGFNRECLFGNLTLRCSLYQADLRFAPVASRSLRSREPCRRQGVTPRRGALRFAPGPPAGTPAALTIRRTFSGTLRSLAGMFQESDSQNQYTSDADDILQLYKYRRYPCILRYYYTSIRYTLCGPHTYTYKLLYSMDLTCVHYTIVYDRCTRPPPCTRGRSGRVHLADRNLGHSPI